MIETAARAICAERWSGKDEAWPSYQTQARAVVTALRRALEEDIAEQCARLCDHLGHELQVSFVGASEAEVVTSVNEAVGAQKCAEAIRALVTKRPEHSAAYARSPLVRSRQATPRSVVRVSGGRWQALWSRWRTHPLPNPALLQQSRALP
jgi:hypothetical protein